LMLSDSYACARCERWEDACASGNGLLTRRREFYWSCSGRRKNNGEGGLQSWTNTALGADVAGLRFAHPALPSVVVTS